MRKKHDLILAVNDPVAKQLLDKDEKPWYIPHETRMMLIANANRTCAICKRQYIPSKLHIDHIYPVTLGGKAHLDNLQVLCEQCNLKKSGHIVAQESYKKGYPIPIIVVSELDIMRQVLAKVEKENA